ncbi:hypothetical protein QAD02_021938 [Eretmocerus hayati]|uniref:Uncharacterized protein n=1 Tax=Eretmocerus hayati TaxID=131215 RepID=A0ACC2PS50_9HYME|nr:hypothetical protein QAD02_021938 [Eretmocerus hayati]
MDRRSCSKNFSYMVDLLSDFLQDLIYWPIYEENQDSMPKYFQYFPKTRVVLDCTEIPIEKPNCLKCRLRLYSHYKGCETVKFLIGVTPCGSICYKSKAYGGRASDKAIFLQSNLLDILDPGRDDIMVDKGFDIDLECLESHIKLIKPPKLGSSAQMSAEDTLYTNRIAAARVHVEGSIQRMKSFQIMKHKIPLLTIPLIDKISIIVAALVNLKNPLLADDK